MVRRLCCHVTSSLWGNMESVGSCGLRLCRAQGHSCAVSRAHYRRKMPILPVPLVVPTIPKREGSG